MKKLILAVGLPRSGKSTHFQKTGLPMVNPDSIRMVLHGTAFRKEAEAIVWAHARLMVESLFEAGHETVVLDATNVTQFRRNEWNSDKWETVYAVFDTPVAECIRRARKNRQDDLVPVIERMAKQFEMPQKEKIQFTVRWLIGEE